MNLSKIIYHPKLKSIRKSIWKLVPSKLYIFGGPLKGTAWLTSASSPNTWLGTYERDKLELFANQLGEHDVVFDIGANVGLYSLLASKFVKSGGQVYTFEPLPRNVKFIREHVRLNKSTNIEIFDCAVSDTDGTTMFKISNSHAMGSISDNGDIQIPTVRLDSIIEEKQLREPTCLKIDVEGAESQVLSGAHMVLQNIKPMIFLAIHGSDQYETCTEILESYDYQIDVIEKTESEHFDLLAEIFATPRTAQ